MVPPPLSRRQDEDWLFDPLGLGPAGRPAFERDGVAQVEEDGLLAPLLRLVGGRGPNRPPPEGASPRTGAPRGGKGPEDTSIGFEDFFKGGGQPLERSPDPRFTTSRCPSWQVVV